MKNICYIVTSTEVYGGEKNLLNLLLKLNRDKYNPIILLPINRSLCNDLLKMNVRYEIWSLHDCKGVLSFIAGFIKSLYFYTKNKINIVHFNQATFWKPPEILAAKLLRIPIITHVHFPLDKLIVNSFVKFSDCFLSVSKTVAKNIPAIKDSKIITIYNGIDISIYENAKNIKNDLGIPNDTFLIGYIGQLIPRKGIEYLVEAANEIVKNNKNFKFLIVGEVRLDSKEYLERIEEKINSLNLNKYFDFIGYRNDIPNILKTIDVFVLPSLKEALPLTLCEAGAAGVPSIATDVNGTFEIVQDGITGYLISPKSSSELSEKIMILMSDRNLLINMGQNAKIFVKNEFNINKQIQKIEHIYNKIATKTFIK